MADPNPALSFENPPARLKLRDDFPPISEKPANLIQVIKAEIAKTGTSLNDVSTIHIAYPHKHPGFFPGHINTAKTSADFLASLKTPWRWQLADPLVETVSLNRSSNTTAMHALMRRQNYTLIENFSFTDPDGRAKLFILTDRVVDQGTTLAELASVITHNGGHVLCAFSDMNRITTLLSPASSTDPYAYDRVSKPIDLGKIFKASADKEGFAFTELQCMTMFDNALSPFGMSAEAMTQGERAILSADFLHHEKSFVTFCHDLRRFAPGGEQLQAR